MTLHARWLSRGEMKWSDRRFDLIRDLTKPFYQLRYWVVRQHSKKTSTGSPSPTKKSRIWLGHCSLLFSLPTHSTTLFQNILSTHSTCSELTAAISEQVPLRPCSLSSNHDEDQSYLAEESHATGTQTPVLLPPILLLLLCEEVLMIATGAEGTNWSFCWMSG